MVTIRITSHNIYYRENRRLKLLISPNLAYYKSKKLDLNKHFQTIITIANSIDRLILQERNLLFLQYEDSF